MSSRGLFSVLVIASLTGLFIYGFFFPLSPPAKIYIAQDNAYKFYEADDFTEIAGTLKKLKKLEQPHPREFPLLERALLVKSLAGVPKIKLELREPRLSYYRSGKYNLVNNEGVLFAEVPQYKIPNIPILRGKAFGHLDIRQKALNVLGQFDEKGPISRETLSEILYDREGLVFVFSGIKGKVIFGEGKIVDKVSRIQKVLKYLRFHGVEARRYDARFSDRVIVKLDKDISSIVPKETP